MHEDTTRGPVRRPGLKPRQSRINLICLPPAGGGPSIYYPLLSLDNDDVQVCPIALPGREDRFDEAIPDSINALADAMANELSELVKQPYAILGYSMGALLGRELVHRWNNAGFDEPIMFTALAARAPHKRYGDDKPLHQLPSAEFRQALAELGGMPEELLSVPEVMELYEPILRGDLRNCELYEHVALPAMKTALHVIHGMQDTLVAREDAEAWSQHTSSEFTFHSIQAPHIVPRDEFITCGRMIMQQLSACISVRQIPA